MKNTHPYQSYEKLRVWKVLSKGIKDLEANGDIEEKTARRYIVGYLSQLLLESKVVLDTPTASSSRGANALDMGA